MVAASVMRRPGGEFRLDAEPLQHGRDLRPAAMHHDRIDAVCSSSTMSRAKRLGGFFGAHGMAAMI